MGRTCSCGYLVVLPWLYRCIRDRHMHRYRYRHSPCSVSPSAMRRIHMTLEVSPRFHFISLWYCKPTMINQVQFVEQINSQLPT
jgi:hypothetical protein